MKSFFFSRLLRERVLLAVLLLGGALVVLNSTLGSLTHLLALDRRLNAEMESQRAVRAQRPLIAARVEAAAQRFDASRTFDSLRLASEVDAMTRAAGIRNSSTGDARTAQGAQFSLHTLQVSLRNVDYPSLVRFYAEVSKRSPYINIEQMSIAANTSNPNQLNASWQISSIELQPR